MSASVNSAAHIKNSPPIGIPSPKKKRPHSTARARAPCCALHRGARLGRRAPLSAPRHARPRLRLGRESSVHPPNGGEDPEEGEPYGHADDHEADEETLQQTSRTRFLETNIVEPRLSQGQCRGELRDLALQRRALLRELRQRRASTSRGTSLAATPHNATRTAPFCGTTNTPLSRISAAFFCPSAQNTVTKKPPS